MTLNFSERVSMGMTKAHYSTPLVLDFRLGPEFKSTYKRVGS